MRVRGLNTHLVRFFSCLTRVQSMDDLGFNYCKKLGSKRTFKPRRLEATPSFRWHEVCLEPEARATYSTDA